MERRRLVEFGQSERQRRLIGGDDVLACGKSSLDEAGRGIDASHQLGYDIDLGVFQDLLEVRRQQFRGHVDASLRVDPAHQNLFYNDFCADLFLDQRKILFESPVGAAAYVAEAQQGDTDLSSLHMSLFYRLSR